MSEATASLPVTVTISSAPSVESQSMPPGMAAGTHWRISGLFGGQIEYNVQEVRGEWIRVTGGAIGNDPIPGWLHVPSQTNIVWVLL